jgi:hypothetical protein
MSGDSIHVASTTDDQAVLPVYSDAMSTPGEPTGTQERETCGLDSMRCFLGFDPADLSTQLLSIDPGYLRIQNAQLREAIANRDEQVKRLEVIVEKLGKEIELGDEITCLQSEIIRLLEAALVCPKEVDSLLAQVQALMKK